MMAAHVSSLVASFGRVNGCAAVCPRGTAGASFEDDRGAPAKSHYIGLAGLAGAVYIDPFPELGIGSRGSDSRLLHGRSALLLDIEDGVAKPDYWLARLLLAHPALFQRVFVKPNELALEKPYIERNIALTQQAPTISVRSRRSRFPQNRTSPLRKVENPIQTFSYPL
jgi:hypothetical protein